MNIDKAINEATQVLRENNIMSSKLDSEILMSKVINKDRNFIFLNLNQVIEKKSLDYFRNLVKKRSCGKPIAQLMSGNLKL